MSEIAIVDYGLNNLKSVQKAFEKAGRHVTIIRTGSEFGRYEALVLPGIGAFGWAMSELTERDLVEPIMEHVEADRPLLGICLGMQLLFTVSNEHGHHDGLDLLSGEVIRFDSPGDVYVDGYKLPQVGWNEIHPPDGAGRSFWQGSVLDETDPGANVYFVHSFYPEPDDRDDVLAVGEYGAQTFVAAVQRDNVVGTQFHPEKSGQVGIEMVQRFCDRHDL